jgi:hypothetical protein
MGITMKIYILGKYSGNDFKEVDRSNSRKGILASKQRHEQIYKTKFSIIILKKTI